MSFLIPEVENPRRAHLRGIPWDKARPPSRFHLCRTHTMELTNELVWIHWCSCGAVKNGTGPWVGKNRKRNR